jgi:hypothetical protein
MSAAGSSTAMSPVVRPYASAVLRRSASTALSSGIAAKVRSSVLGATESPVPTGLELGQGWSGMAAREGRCQEADPSPDD